MPIWDLRHIPCSVRAPTNSISRRSAGPCLRTRISPLYKRRVSANSMLFSSGYGVASLSFGGGGLGSAGSAAGAGSGGGSAGGQQSPSRDALLAAQGTSTDNRDLPGGDDNAADLPAAANTPHRFDTPGAPGRSGEPGTPHAAALTTLQESNSPSNASISVVSVPEPGTLLLMSAGLCGLGFIQRRRRG